MKLSSYEKIIYRILKEAGAQFETEKQFKDLRNGYMRYDFYLPEINTLLEIQGPQHFICNNFFYKKKSDFTKAQERDRHKCSYALAHGLSLYCIPFWEMESIKSYDDIFQDKFLVQSKFHNDIVYREYKKQQKTENVS